MKKFREKTEFVQVYNFRISVWFQFEKQIYKQHKFKTGIWQSSIGDKYIYISNIWDDEFLSNSAVVNLHRNRGSPWVGFDDNYYFDSYGCAPPKTILEYIKAEHGSCIFSENEFRKKNVGVIVYISFFACFYVQGILKQQY